MNRRLRAGMVGGGTGAFIGAVHRMAMRLDDRIELVAGAFSSDAERSRAPGEELLLDPRRVYRDYATMVDAEVKLPRDQRIDFASIVTPNATHVPIATAFLEAGFNVVCDKPLAISLQEALALRATVQATRKVFALTHNYSGYAMVKEARALVRAGELGVVRKIVIDYPQGWMSEPLPNENKIDGPWRGDPAQSGPSGCLADIGTHAEHLARYITGLRIKELCAEFTAFVPGRRLEDDASLLLRYEGGAKGVLTASQISIGEENGLTIRIYGSKAGLRWRQETPHELVLKYSSAPDATHRPTQSYLSLEALRFARLPGGHPEGFIEAFANIYREAARAIEAEIVGAAVPADCDFPTIDDGVEGMAFLQCAVESAQAGAVWKKMPKT